MTIAKELKYWRMPQFGMFMKAKPTDYTYVLAHIAGAGGKRQVIGMVELQINPYCRNTIGLKYISVAEGHKAQGIGSRLVDLMCKELSQKNLNLERSRASEEAQAIGFTEHVTRKVLAYAISVVPIQKSWYLDTAELAVATC